MTSIDYQTLRARIEDQYGQDLAALDRIWALFHGDESPEPTSPEKRKGRQAQKLSKSEAMRASWARRKAGKEQATEKGLSQKAFSKFLVNGPVSVGGNGKD